MFTISFDDIPGVVPRQINLYPPPNVESTPPSPAKTDSPVGSLTPTKHSAMPIDQLHLDEHPDNPPIPVNKDTALPTNQSDDHTDAPPVEAQMPNANDDCMWCLELEDVLWATKDLLITTQAAVSAKLGETQEAVQQSAHAIAVYDTLDKIYKEQGGLFVDSQIPECYRNTAIPPDNEEPQLVLNVRFQPFRRDHFTQLDRFRSDSPPNKNSSRLASVTPSISSTPGPSRHTPAPNTKPAFGVAGPSKDCSSHKVILE